MPSQTLDWSLQGDVQGVQKINFTGIDHNTGLMNVKATFIQDGDLTPNEIGGPGVQAGDLYTGGNYAGGTVKSGIQIGNEGSSSSGDSNTVTTRLDFTANNTSLYQNAVQNASFWISDIDRLTTGNQSNRFTDQIVIRAYDANGNRITGANAVTFSNVGSNLTVNNNTDEITSTSGGDLDRTSAAGSIRINIAGPVARIEIDYDNLGMGNQWIYLSDINFSTIDAPPPCFVLGTLIRTERGEVAVEDLRVGDMVLTRDHGAQPIRWIGQRSVSGQQVDLAPIVISKGIFGNRREIRVSPEHRMVVGSMTAELLFGEPEVLVAAHSLIDGDRIWQERVETVTYFHLLFDRHELIWAEGALSESYHPGDTRLAGVAPETRAEIMQLFPELDDSFEGYGPLALPALKRAEAALLVVGHC